MKDVMIDIETFGNGKHAAIVQIGACYFDRANGNIGDTFKVNIDAVSAEKSGAQLDADTVYWWMSQSKEAIESVTVAPRIDIVEALNMLNDFLKPAVAIWSHATFDFVILTESYKRLGIKTLFHYRTARDIRTLVDLANINTKSHAFVRDGIHHDGLADCLFQVKYCVAAFQKLKSTQALEHQL